MEREARQAPRAWNSYVPRAFERLPGEAEINGPEGLARVGWAGIGGALWAALLRLGVG